MKVLYLDCASGISGDMFIGAILDAGLNFSSLEKELSKLKLDGYKIKKRTVMRHSIRSTKFDVLVDDKGRKPRSLKKMLAIIDRSQLSDEVKALSKKIFLNLGKTEARIHKNALENVHFHEMGDVDSIVDIVGAAIAVKKMGINKIYASPVNLGTTAPATLNLLKGCRVNFSKLPYELTTPTGAAIFKTLVEAVGCTPSIDVESIGYGAGSYKIKEIPNVLKVVIGQVGTPLYDEDKIIVIETNIDDMKPIMYNYIIEKLISAGALDVSVTPTYMKKARIGVLLTVLTKDLLLKKIANIIFEETSTIGLRYYEVKRFKLKRKIKKVKTRYGTVNFKISRINKGDYRLSPEYEDCRKLAKKLNLPLQKIYQDILEKAVN